MRQSIITQEELSREPHWLYQGMIHTEQQFTWVGWTTRLLVDAGAVRVGPLRYKSKLSKGIDLMLEDEARLIKKSETLTYVAQLKQLKRKIDLRDQEIIGLKLHIDSLQKLIFNFDSIQGKL